MFDPTPDLPDDTLIEMVRFPTVVRNALRTAGVKRISEIRAMSDGELRRLRLIGKANVAYLRKMLGSSPSDSPPTIQKRKLAPRVKPDLTKP